MKREYWNGLANRYETEVFDVLGNDKKHLIRGLIEKYGGSRKMASDYGCGPGKFLPMLAENFGRVNAIDISYKFIAKAKNKYKHLSNIKYQTTDLSKDGLKLEKTHFALSVNMLIMPALACRVRILDVIIKHLLKNGHLVLVVPSLESAMLADFRLIEWNLRIGVKPSSAIREIFGDSEKPDYLNLCQGVVPVDGVPTKHYLKEELAAMLESRGMRIIDIRKIEYLWDTEFDRPPKWMKEPYPWDWLAVAKKK
ncbi:MAG: methyltransferase domain-containing protein [Sedimentisphaerales bacterium]|jgi:SAM-dependent methyltransferase